MKRTMLIAFVVVLFASLAACGFRSNEKQKEKQNTSSKPTDTLATTQSTAFADTEPVTTDKPQTTDNTTPATEPLSTTVEVPTTEEPISSEEITTQSISTSQETEAPADSCTITFDIEFVENLFFSKYDVDFKIDGATQKTLAHGVDDVMTINLDKGIHSITFSKNGSSSIKGETTITVTEAAKFCYKIACYNDKVTVENKDGSNSSTPVSPADPSETTPITEAPEEIKYGINDVVILDDIEYTVTDVYDKKVIDSYWDDGKTENNFVVITIKIKNNGTREEYIRASYFTYTIGQNKYNTHNAALYLNNGLWLGESIGAGLSKTVRIVFEIPEDHKNTDTLVIQPSWFGERAIIYMEKINN